MPKAASRFPHSLSVEENCHGGLGIAILEVLAIGGRTAGFVSSTSGDETFIYAASQEYLRAACGPSVDGAVAAWTSRK